MPWRSAAAAVLAVFLLNSPVLPQQRITTPRDYFGSGIGDDYFLVNYSRMIDYWRKLAQESPRVVLSDIGTTSEGRTMTMAVVTSAANQQNLARYKEIAGRLARAEQLTDPQAEALAAEGKAVVWIDGGLHADETLGAQQLIETVFQLASANDPETLRLLDNVIVLACIANPDGMELVSDWYMREADPARRSLSGLPVLYQKYAGHDDNRDFFMSALPETRAVNGVLYREWFPQIVYDHHQTGPAGSVMFSPPFRDPFNFNFDPLVMTMLGEVAGAMHSRFASENKPGVVSGSAATYSAWWNGGMRTSPYFHNMIGLLTESVGDPAPITIPFVPARMLPGTDGPFPIAPQTWHFRQSVEYSLTANRAVLDFAARNKDRLLFNIYRMGRNSIERGSRDHWTVTPQEIAGLPNDVSGYNALRKPELRDPRGYILPSDQPDFPTAAKFVNTLILNGVAVSRASAAFTAGGKTYPAGSYVVRTAQAFRPHIMDMFEPQDYPNDFAYPGGPPNPPYDSAGWTLAYQMGVRFDRILEAFDGPFVPVTGEARPPAGAVSQLDSPSGYLFTHEANDAFVAVNRLMASGEAVYWLTQETAVDGRKWPAGTNYVRASAGLAAKLEGLAAATGIGFQAAQLRPDTEVLRLRPVRIALSDRYGGSSPSGWTRLVLEQFSFPYTVVYPQQLDSGRLIDKFDVLILVDDSTFAAAPPRSQAVLPEYRDRTGGLSISQTVPQLKQFLEAGGSVLAIGRSTALGALAGLPVGDALTEAGPAGGLQRLPTTKFYVPGSILQARVDVRNPIAYGLPDRVDFFFDNSPSFGLGPSAASQGLRQVAWFDSDKPLRSGWAWGQSYLKDVSAVVEAPVGKGKLVLYGPEILFRAQPHGTFKLLFNGIYAGRAERTSLLP